MIQGSIQVNSCAKLPNEFSEPIFANFMKKGQFEFNPNHYYIKSPFDSNFHHAIISGEFQIRFGALHENSFRSPILGHFTRIISKVFFWFDMTCDILGAWGNLQFGASKILQTRYQIGAFVETRWRVRWYSQRSLLKEPNQPAKSAKTRGEKVVLRPHWGIWSKLVNQNVRAKNATILLLLYCTLQAFHDISFHINMIY